SDPAPRQPATFRAISRAKGPTGSTSRLFALNDLAGEPINRNRNNQNRSEGMVQLGGFEPPTSGSIDRRSNHLSYSCTGRSSRAASGRKLGASPALGKGGSSSAPRCKKARVQRPGLNKPNQTL